MSFTITEEQKFLQENIFLAGSRLNGSLDLKDKWKLIASTGLIGIVVEKRFGGSELGAFEMLLALEALAKGNPDNGLSFAIAAHTLSCVVPLNIYGTDIQKLKYLPDLINGNTIAANAMTESESGSDVFNMQCKAVKKENYYIVNGTKTFVSNSVDSGLVITYANTNADKGFFGGITCFIAEEGNYQKGSLFKKMGLENCSLGEIIFNDAEISEQNILGKEGGGAVIFNHSMEWERICMAGIHLGAMERVLAKTLNFVKERKSSGQSISKFQSISHTIADMEMSLQVARSYSYSAAKKLDAGENVSKDAAITKLFVSNTVKSFMLHAMQIFGGYGYIADYGMSRKSETLLLHPFIQVLQKFKKI